MEEAIKKKLAELGDKQPEEVRARISLLFVFSRWKPRRPLLQLFELQIEGVQSPKVEGLSDGFQALASLSFVNCGLNTLDGLPKLPALTTVSRQKRIERQNRRACERSARVETAVCLSLCFNKRDLIFKEYCHVLLCRA